MDQTQNINALVAVLAKQREAATNAAAEQEARAIVLERQLADMTAERDRLQALIPKDVEVLKDSVTQPA